MSNTRIAYRKFYNKEYEEKKYNKIISDFLKFAFEELLEKGYVELPKIGHFKIIGKKVKVDSRKRFKGLTVDWGKTRKLKRIVLSTNEHSNFIRYKIVWKYKKHSIQNLRLYFFVPKRTLKRTLATKIKQGKEYFYG